MTSIVCIVEGDGEVQALPVLLRRLAEARGAYDIDIPMPIRVRRDKFIQRDDEFRGKLRLAGAKAGVSGAVLILLDADDDCPVTLATNVTGRAANVLPNSRVCVVIANREYEAWLLAGAASLAGKRGLREDLESPPNPDGMRDAKRWLSEHIQNYRYHPVSDQPALTACLDIELAAQGSRSLRKFIKTFDDIVQSWRAV